MLNSLFTACQAEYHYSAYCNILECHVLCISSFKLQSDCSVASILSLTHYDLILDCPHLCLVTCPALDCFHLCVPAPSVKSPCLPLFFRNHGVLFSQGRSCWTVLVHWATICTSVLVLISFFSPSDFENVSVHISAARP